MKTTKSAEFIGSLMQAKRKQQLNLYNTFSTVKWSEVKNKWIIVKPL